jgi:lipopolysaccharide export system protein LptA
MYMISRRHIISISVLLFCFWALCPLTGASGKELSTKKNLVDRNTPIQIASDRMDAYNEKGMVVFNGNAVATQGDRTIRAETITLYYKKKAAGGEQTEAMDIQKSGDLDKIEAKGNVRITQMERVVTGNEAVYLQDAQKIIIKGNAVLSEGKNVVRGEQVVVFLNENRGVVESSNKSERVNATIFPSVKKDTKP